MSTPTSTTPFTTASEIAGEIYARLAAITTARSCETDIGVRAYRGRRAISDTQIPCVVLIEGNDTPTDRPGRLPAAAITQRFVVAAYLPCNPDNPNDAAHAAIRDIKRAFFARNGNLDGKVVRITYRGRDIGPRADGAPIVYVQVDLDVDYVENLSAP